MGRKLPEVHSAAKEIFSTGKNGVDLQKIVPTTFVPNIKNVLNNSNIVETDSEKTTINDTLNKVVGSLGKIKEQNLSDMEIELVDAVIKGKDTTDIIPNTYETFLSYYGGKSLEAIKAVDAIDVEFMSRVATTVLFTYEHMGILKDQSIIEIQKKIRNETKYL